MAEPNDRPNSSPQWPYLASPNCLAIHGPHVRNAFSLTRTTYSSRLPRHLRTTTGDDCYGWGRSPSGRGWQERARMVAMNLSGGGGGRWWWRMGTEPERRCMAAMTQMAADGGGSATTASARHRPRPPPSSPSRLPPQPSRRRRLPPQPSCRRRPQPLPSSRVRQRDRCPPRRHWPRLLPSSAPSTGEERRGRRRNERLICGTRC